MRWDDLARTPMGNLEWVRRRGLEGIVGLRSLDAQSKTGVRPWVASYLGVTEHSDDWLAILVKLLLEIHGSSWQLHDHTGKSFSPDGKSAKVGVASFSQNVALRCERLAGYLDVDERPHLCSVHCDPPESSPDEKEDVDQSEELPELKAIASSGAAVSEASPPQKKPENVDPKDI